jgi:hypothetical protein
MIIKKQVRTEPAFLIIKALQALIIYRRLLIVISIRII